MIFILFYTITHSVPLADGIVRSAKTLLDVTQAHDRAQSL